MITIGKTLYIQRHCMQQLLHEALIFQPKSCCGLLTGAGNMIESVHSVTKFINQSAAEMPQADLNGHDIIGIFLSSTASHKPDQQLLEQLEKLCITLTGTAPSSCLHIDLGHQGRMDAHLFTDTTLTQVQPLEMLEENGLYPDSSNR